MARYDSVSSSLYSKKRSPSFYYRSWTFIDRHDQELLENDLRPLEFRKRSTMNKGFLMSFQLFLWVVLCILISFPTLVSGDYSGLAVDLSNNPINVPQYFSISTDGPYPGVGSFVFPPSNYVTFSDSRFGGNWWSNGFTLEAWVKYSSFANTMQYYGGDYGLPSSFGNIAYNTMYQSYWSFGPDENGRLMFTPGGSGYYFRSTDTIPLNQWTHIVIQAAPAVDNLVNVYMHINGQPVLSNSHDISTTGTWSQTYFTIGTQNYQSPSFLASEVRISFSANLYPIQGFSVPTSPFTTQQPSSVAMALQYRLARSSVPDFGQPADYSPIPVSFPACPTSVDGPYPGVGSLKFSSNYMQLTDNRFYSSWGQATGFTFEAWVKYASFDNTVSYYNSLLYGPTYTYNTNPMSYSYAGPIPTSFGNMLPTSNYAYWSIGADTSGRLTLYIYNQGYTLSSYNYIPLNTWTHICWMTQGSTAYLYVNGVLSGTKYLYNSATVNLNSFTIGSYYNVKPNFLVSDVRISYNSNVYPLSGFPVPNGPLGLVPSSLGMTSLLLQYPIDVSKQTFNLVDSSPYPLTLSSSLISSTNGASLSSDGPYPGIGSISLSGSGFSVSDSRFQRSWAGYGATGFTFEAWVKYSSFSNTVVSIGVGSAPSSFGIMSTTSYENYWSFGANPSGNLAFFFNQGRVVATSTTIPLNQWTHICFIAYPTSYYGAGNVYLFINGVMSLSTSYYQAYVYNNFFTMGQFANNVGPTFLASDIRITNGIAYSISGFTPPTAPLSAAPSNVGSTDFMLQYLTTIPACPPGTYSVQQNGVAPCTPCADSQVCPALGMTSPKVSYYTSSCNFTSAATSGTCQRKKRPMDLMSGAGRSTMSLALAAIKVNANFTGNVFVIRRGSDNALGNVVFRDSPVPDTLYVTNANKTLTEWLGGGNVVTYVKSWFDQSGNSKNIVCSQTTNAYQPYLDVFNRYVSFANNAWLSCNAPFISSGNAAYTFSLKHGPTSNPYGAFFYQGIFQSYRFLGFRLQGYSDYTSIWYNRDLTTTPSGFVASGNIVSETYDGGSTSLNQRVIYVNSIPAGRTSYGSGPALDMPSTGLTIEIGRIIDGSGADGAGGYYYSNMPMYFLYAASSALSDSDRSILETTTRADAFNGNSYCIDKKGTPLIGCRGNNYGVLSTTKQPTSQPTNIGGYLVQPLPYSQSKYKVTNPGAFAVVDFGGVVYTWGNASTGGSVSPSIGTFLQSGGVTQVVGSHVGFLAIKNLIPGGACQMAAWGTYLTGGRRRDSLFYGVDGIYPMGFNHSMVRSVVSNERAYAVLFTNGKIITLGDDACGGGGGGATVQGLTNVIALAASACSFAAVTSSGNVYSWGDETTGGGFSSDNYPKLRSVESIISNENGFIAITSQGTIVPFGNSLVLAGLPPSLQQHPHDDLTIQNVPVQSIGDVSVGLGVDFAPTSPSDLSLGGGIWCGYLLRWSFPWCGIIFNLTIWHGVQ